MGWVGQPFPLFFTYEAKCNEEKTDYSNNTTTLLNYYYTIIKIK